MSQKKKPEGLKEGFGKNTFKCISDIPYVWSEENIQTVYQKPPSTVRDIANRVKLLKIQYLSSHSFFFQNNLSFAIQS